MVQNQEPFSRKPIKSRLIPRGLKTSTVNIIWTINSVDSERCGASVWGVFDQIEGVFEIELYLIKHLID